MKHDHELSPEEFQRVLAERARQYDLTHPEQTRRRADEAARLYIEAEQTITDLRQRNEDAEALLIIARAERDTARATQEQLQGVVTAQEAEIKRLRAVIDEICSYSRTDRYSMMDWSHQLVADELISIADKADGFIE